MYRKLPQSHDNVLGYEVAGTVTEEEYRQVAGELREVIDEHGKVRVLVRVPEMPDQELRATLGDRLRFLKDHVGDIERYALVSEDRTAEWLGKVTDKVTPIELKLFSTDEEPQAWQWVATGRQPAH